MMKRVFDWDPEKDRTNRLKHKVAFSEAVTLFLDPFVLSKYDDAHSENEDRWVSLGISELDRTLLVIHTERILDLETEIIRLISARRAIKTEEQYYKSRRPL